VRNCYNFIRYAEVAQQVEQRTENELPKLNQDPLLSNLISNFIESRREGLSHRTIQFYQCYLNHSKSVISLTVTGYNIQLFLKNLKCTNGGKHAYFRALKAFYNWLYSPKSGYRLESQDNPILYIEPPKLEKKILPALNSDQVSFLIEKAESVRDKSIISLFAESGLRLSELTNINPHNIDWQNRLIKVLCKGNREGLAVFGTRTESLLKEWLSIYKPDGKLWDLNPRGISIMLYRLSARTGLPCNPHTFRRTFASELAKKGIDVLHIKRLGRWETVQMVERYTRSVGFEDSLKLYREAMK
jgi:site-specific recombinase XerD